MSARMVSMIYGRMNAQCSLILTGGLHCKRREEAVRVIFVFF